MKNVYVSSIRDEAEEVFKLAEEFQLGIKKYNRYRRGNYNSRRKIKVFSFMASA